MPLYVAFETKSGVLRALSNLLLRGAGKLRVGTIAEVIHSAAPGDPEIEALWNRIETEYHSNQRAIVESLAAMKALRSGLDVDRATDILWTLNHPTLWQLLVRQRGWSPDEYEQWCADATCTQLLRTTKKGG